MQARTHGAGIRGVAVRTHHNRILRRELDAARRLRLLPACFPWRIDRRVQRLNPALTFFVADGGNHEEISRARRGDIGQTSTLGAVAPKLVLLVIDQIPRRTTGELNRTHAPCGVEIAAGGRAVQLGRHVHEHDDGELEALRLVDGHQPDAVAALFENRRFGRLSAFRLRAQLVEKPAERDAAFGFIAPRQLGHVRHVGQHLLAAVLERKSDVGAGRFEELRDGRGDGHVVARFVQRLQQRERRENRGESLEVGRAEALRYRVLGLSLRTGLPATFCLNAETIAENGWQ